MALSVSCPQCGYVARVPEQYAGQAVRCNQCGRAVQVPGAGPGRAPVAPQSSEASPTGTRTCPYCGETIKVIARKCPHCREFLDPALARAQKSAGSAQLLQELEKERVEKKARDALLCAVIGCFCIGFGVVLGLIGIVQGTRANNEARARGMAQLGAATAAVIIGAIAIFSAITQTILAMRGYHLFR